MVIMPAPTFKEALQKLASRRKVTASRYAY